MSSMDKEDRIMAAGFITALVIILIGIHATILGDPDTGWGHIAWMWVGLVVVVAGGGLIWAAVYRILLGYEEAEKRDHG